MQTANAISSLHDPDQLQQLVKAAQAGETKALCQLCTYYRPLIMSLAHKSLFFKALGPEEAASIASLEFIEFILSYRGSNYNQLPGLIKIRLHCRLVDAVRRTHGGYAAEISLDFTDEMATTALLGSLEEEASPTPAACLEGKEARSLVRAAMSLLPERYKILIFYLYNCRYTEKEIAQRLQCTTRNVRKLKTAALNRLKDFLSSYYYPVEA